VPAKRRKKKGKGAKNNSKGEQLKKTKGKETNTKKTAGNPTEADDPSTPHDDDAAENMDISLARQPTQTPSEAESAALTPGVDASQALAQLAAKAHTPASSTTSPASEPQLDPDGFMAVEPHQLRSRRPDAEGGGEEATEDGREDARRITIVEAFADDDIANAFREEKEANIDADKPKDLDLALPGWGDWGGQGLKLSAKKRRRLLFKAPAGPPRQDHGLGHVILSEKRNEALRAHQPSELPYYVNSVAAFEASIRAPIGRTWLPAAAHLKLTRPAVSTRAGTVIQPMDESALLSKKAKQRRKKPL